MVFLLQWGKSKILSIKHKNAKNYWGVKSMTRMFFLPLFLFIHTIHVSGQDSPYKEIQLPEDAVKRMTEKAEKLIYPTRYMEINCRPVTYPGWEGFPLLECSYNVKDRNGDVKPAKVIMLNPSADQLSRWIVYTCMTVKGCADSLYTDQLLEHIRTQSGAQFPVAGVVYEDMENDGFNKIYCFRNGVTVKVKGIEHAGIKPLSSEEIESTIHGSLDSTWTGQYARIQSTTREEYKAFGGTIDVGDKNNRKMIWLDVVRDLYQSAWGKDANFLLIAWARQNLK
jgi:hypothetical protein